MIERTGEFNLSFLSQDADFEVFKRFGFSSGKDTDKFAGFEEYVDGDGVCLIEWAELIKGIIPENAVSIKITKDLSKGLDYRKIEVEE